MGKFNFSTVMMTDTVESAVHFYSMSDGNHNSIKHEMKKYHGRAFDTDFFEKFGKMLEEYTRANPSAQGAEVVIVLPDNVIATDLINIPTVRRSKVQFIFDTAVNGVYKNSEELKINKYPVAQNKQYSVYSMSMVRKEILRQFFSVCTTNKMTPQIITYAANSAVNAAQSFNSKLKSATFMLLDIKQEFTRISLVSKGRTSAYYSLPFGYSILYKTKLTAEDMLFEHSVADLAVLNAKEKAKAKQLTMMQQDDSAVQEANKENGNETESNGQTTDEFDDTPKEKVQQPLTATGTVKTLPPKTPRVLPKFMLRPTPHNDQEYIYENFRIFVKWALNLIQSNDKTIFREELEGVFVNIPKDYDFVFDMVNAEAEENKVKFFRIDTHTEKDIVSDNFELYGGFFASQMNKTNNF